jgi:hypothetical protein
MVPARGRHRAGGRGARVALLGARQRRRGADPRLRGAVALRLDRALRQRRGRSPRRARRRLPRRDPRRRDGGAARAVRLHRLGGLGRAVMRVWRRLLASGLVTPDGGRPTPAPGSPFTAALDRSYRGEVVPLVRGTPGHHPDTSHLRGVAVGAGGEADRFRALRRGHGVLSCHRRRARAPRGTCRRDRRAGRRSGPTRRPDAGRDVHGDPRAQGIRDADRHADGAEARVAGRRAARRPPGAGLEAARSFLVLRRGPPSASPLARRVQNRPKVERSSRNVRRWAPLVSPHNAWASRRAGARTVVERPFEHRTKSKEASELE